MKLIRFDDNKIGLVVELPSGPCVIDVIASIGALVPEDPISHGVLNGLLRDNRSWELVIQHWEMARIGLHRLANLARTASSLQIVLRQLNEINVLPGKANWIDVLDMQLNAVTQGPTGREIMESQFKGAPPDPTQRKTIPSQYSGESAAVIRTAQLILLSDVRKAR
jgi:hypothetical protein